MTALVLGASGSLGSALVTALKERDEVVVGVARGSQPRGLKCDSWIYVDSYENFAPPSAEWDRIFMAF
ncbi:MAG: NAD-dependent epimerase/dehydratase family protein, partial [Actinomycetota bacterium]